MSLFANFGPNQFEADSMGNERAFLVLITHTTISIPQQMTSFRGESFVIDFERRASRRAAGLNRAAVRTVHHGP